MSETRTEVLVGAAVLAAAVGFLIYAAQLTGFDTGSRGGDGYDLSASFRSAEGVSVGTDVRLAGVKVGSVSDLALNADTFRAEVTFRMQGAVDIPEDSTAAVSSEGLLGGTFVEIIPGGSPFALEAGDAFIDTQGAVSLVGLLARFVSGVGQ